MKATMGLDVRPQLNQWRALSLLLEARRMTTLRVGGAFFTHSQVMLAFIRPDCQKSFYGPA